jgi:hypothetical protein
VRSLARKLVVSGATGLLMVATAWAGISLTPAGIAKPVTSATSKANGLPRLESKGSLRVASAADDLGADELLVGASKIDIAPLPDASKGEVWEHDPRKCTNVEDGDPAGSTGYATDSKSPWPENPNCIYAGGFGVGPAQPLVAFDDQFGLWTRSVAFLRDGKAVVLTILDAEGYFGRYNKMCAPEKACGARDLAEQLGAEFNLPASSFVFAATHSHAAPDFIGGWGGVPVWYMRQVAESMRESVRRAINGARPATLEAGEVVAHQFNAERRDTYWSAEDPSLNWVRALGRDGSTIATTGTYSAHPTSFGGSWTVANADWPGQFDKGVESRFGGVGLVFNAGLGNMSARANNHGSMGAGLAQLVPALGAGTAVPSPVINTKQAAWDQPITNGPLGSLGAFGLFDRPFGGPASVTAGKSADRPCASASALSVNVAVTAAKIGGILVTAAPGEIFSNASNTIEERAPITALAIGQANDALGYMPQEFEFDVPTQQGTGFVQPPGPNGQDVVEYEEAYSLDRCFGEKSLTTQMALLDQL